MRFNQSERAAPASVPGARARASTYRTNPVAAACLLMLAASASHAQQSDSTVQAAKLDTVVVTGIAHSIETSIATKRNSDSIVEAVSAEDIGKLPDSSIAESLARLPGVTGQRGPDGRVTEVSIRGLSPEFAGTLLNGREMVSSNDSRAVEFDQFPSELLGSALVYKTPDGALVGQGMSGTIDLRTRRPLETRGQEVALNVRGSSNSNGTIVPGVASPIGSRISASYINQFADNTIGVAVGFARLDEATQVKNTQLAAVADASPWGIPISGNVPSLKPYAPGQTGQALLPMYFVATNSTKRNTRDGLMGVLEYKPNAALHSTLDLYYSKFDTHEVGNIFHESLYQSWSGPAAAATLSNVGTTQVGMNTYVTSATIDHAAATTGNFDTKRTDTIGALGWNTELKLDDKWTGIADLSFSRDSRKDTYMEVYGAPFDTASQSFTHGAYKWNMPIGDGQQSFVPLQANFLSNPATYRIGANTDGFDWVPDNPAWAGAVRTPVTTDAIKSLRLSAKRPLDGIFSNLVAGLNFTQRDKNVSKNESRILMLKDSNGNYIRTVPASAILAPSSNGIMRIDVPALLGSGAVRLEPGQFTKLPANDSDVHEKVTTAFMKLDIDTEVGGTPIRGNVGLQAVRADQNANGWEYRGDDAHPDPSLLIKHSGGAAYTNILPSLNLVADLKNNWVARLGLAKTLARPNITDMNSGTSTPTVKLDNASLPTAGQWNMAYSGNPQIRPWIADAFDLSLEKYFGKRSYVSMAAFDKYLESFVFNGVTTQDNSVFPAYPPPGVTPLKYGPVTKPLNGHGGTVKGLELSGSLEGGLLTPMLDGFGVVASGTKLFSNIVDPTGMQIKMTGLSGTSDSITVYYEKSGFSARVSERYRAPFTATTRDIYGNNTTRQQDADRVVDIQMGYAFENGAYKGLSLMLQVNNVSNHPTQDQHSAGVGNNIPDPTQLVPNYRYYYGRQLLAGVNYKF